MKKKEEEFITFEELPDTLTPEDYSKWRRIGEPSARNRFHAQGFPLIFGDGSSRQIADKRAVLLYELGLKEEDRKEVLKQLVKEMFYRNSNKKNENNENTESK